LIHSGKQLFGNYTPQPPCPPGPTAQVACENGFRALAVYDDNHDGVIDSRDAVWRKLRLWSDRNMNGEVDPGELLTLEEAGVTSISLAYSPSHEIAAYALLRYRGSVTGLANPTIYDAYLEEQ
jgi:hypothetical protein